MDLQEFRAATEALLSELERDLGPNWGDAIRENLGYGEEGIALDQLLCALVEDPVRVSPAQRDRLGDLVDYFGPLGDQIARHYPYLDPATIDRLTVVEVD